MLDLKNELVCNIKMFICVRGIDFVYISTIFLLDLGIVPTVYLYINTLSMYANGFLYE
jgi:hypothetical protein